MEVIDRATQESFDAHKGVRQQPTGGVHIFPGLKVQCVESFVA